MIRVIRRLEDPDVEIVEPPNPKGVIPPVRRSSNLIRYCGYDPREAVWEHA